MTSHAEEPRLSAACLALFGMQQTRVALGNPHLRGCVQFVCIILPFRVLNTMIDVMP